MKKEEKISDLWSTPQDVFDELNKKFGPFDLDVCANDENAKCPSYFDYWTNGLALEWVVTQSPEDIRPAVCFMNPPYSSPYPWVKKASEEAKNGAKVVALLKADHSTAWYKDFIEKDANHPYPGVTVWKYPKRIKFVPPPGLLDKNGKPMKASAKWPSIVVVFEKA